MCPFLLNLCLLDEGLISSSILPLTSIRKAFLLLKEMPTLVEDCI